MDSKISCFGVVLLGVCASTSSFSKTRSGEITVQGVVSPTFEINFEDLLSREKVSLDTSEDGSESKIGAIQMSYNHETFVGSQLFVESKNEGHLVAMTKVYEVMKPQKYHLKIQDEVYNMNQDAQLRPTCRNRMYDLAVPTEVCILPARNVERTLKKTYNLHLVLPAIEKRQNSVVYTDTLVFTFMDNN